MCNNCADKEEGDCIVMLSEKKQQLDMQTFQQFLHGTQNDRFLKFTEALVKEWKPKRVRLFALVEARPCALHSPNPKYSHCDTVYRIDGPNTEFYMTPNQYGVLPAWHYCPAHAKSHLESVERKICSMTAIDWKLGDEYNKTKGIEDVTSGKVDAVLSEQKHVMDMVEAAREAEVADGCMSKE